MDLTPQAGRDVIARADDTYNPISRQAEARDTLDAARQDLLLALQDAAVLGVPLPELARECKATARAMRDVLVLALAGESAP